MRLADDSTPMEKRDSRWVIWAQFELFVDEIMSIVELYHARLDWFQGRLHKEEADFPKEDIKSIIQTVRIQTVVHGPCHCLTSPPGTIRLTSSSVCSDDFSLSAASLVI